MTVTEAWGKYQSTVAAFKTVHEEAKSLKNKAEKTVESYREQGREPVADKLGELVTFSTRPSLPATTTSRPSKEGENDSESWRSRSN